MIRRLQQKQHEGRLAFRIGQAQVEAVWPEEDAIFHLQDVQDEMEHCHQSGHIGWVFLPQMRGKKTSQEKET